TGAANVAAAGGGEKAGSCASRGAVGKTRQKAKGKREKGKKGVQAGRLPFSFFLLPFAFSPPHPAPSRSMRVFHSRPVEIKQPMGRVPPLPAAAGCSITQAIKGRERLPSPCASHLRWGAKRAVCQKGYRLQGGRF